MNAVDANLKEKTPTKQAAQSKLTKRQQEGIRLLQAAEAESAGMGPEMRAFLLWELSKAYAPIDRKKSERLLNAAFLTTKAIQPSADAPRCGVVEYGNAGDIQSWLQQSIISEMIEDGNLHRAESLISEAEPVVRDRVISALIKQYISQRNIAHAEVLLHEFANSEEYPYDAASALLSALPLEQGNERLVIFNEALANFEQNGTTSGIRNADLGSLLEHHWQQLPVPVVMQAIDELLEEAKSIAQNKPTSLGSNGKTVSLTSTYQARLFELLLVDWPGAPSLSLGLACSV